MGSSGSRGRVDSKGKPEVLGDGVERGIGLGMRGGERMGQDVVSLVCDTLNWGGPGDAHAARCSQSLDIWAQSQGGAGGGIGVTWCVQWSDS